LLDFFLSQDYQWDKRSLRLKSNSPALFCLQFQFYLTDWSNRDGFGLNCWWSDFCEFLPTNEPNQFRTLISFTCPIFPVDIR
jgi:hypothetical protein